MVLDLLVISSFSLQFSPEESAALEGSSASGFRSAAVQSAPTCYAAWSRTTISTRSEPQMSLSLALNPMPLLEHPDLRHSLARLTSGMLGFMDGGTASYSEDDIDRCRSILVS